MQDQINQLTLELNTVSTEIANKTNEIEDLSNQLDDSEDNDTLLSNQIVQLQTEIYDLNQEKNDLLIALSENSTTQQKFGAPNHYIKYHNCGYSESIAAIYF